jgi:hypothetical protein
VRRPGAAADEGGHPAGQRDVDLLRANEVDMSVDAAGRQDEPFSGNYFSRGPDDEPVGDAGHHVGVSSLADSGDAPVFDSDVCFVDAGPVDDECVGDDEVERPVVAHTRHLPHPVAQYFSSAEFALVTVNGVVVLYLGDQISISKANLVTRRRPIDGGVVPP